MKTQLIFLALYFFVATVNADEHQNFEEKTQVVHKTTTQIQLALNQKTVLCSRADYSDEYLKVLIPELGNLTLLNHQNQNAGAPCVAAGACSKTHRPEVILDISKPAEEVQVTVEAVRHSIIDHRAKVCTVVLSENVSVNIRGIPFIHQRSADLGSRPYADCLR